MELEPLERGRQWIAQLGGSGVLPRSFVSSGALAVGHFRFPELSEEVEATPLPFHYISVTLGGPLRIEAHVDGARVDARVRKGQSIIMAAGRSNSWRWDRPTEEALIFIHPDYLREVAEQTGADAPDVLDRFVFEDPGLRRTILTMVDELATPVGPSGLFLDMAAQAVALRLLRRHCQGKQVAGEALLSARQLRRIIDMVENRLCTDIDLNSLADAAGVSRFHFVRSFKATTGLPPHRWLTARRMERAKTLLEKTGFGMLEIAAAVGFESQSHFGQVFRLHAGMTPSQWRNLRRN